MKVTYFSPKTVIFYKCNRVSPGF